MKSILALTLISIAFCNIFNGDLNEYLKKNAPFEVYEPEENPFRDYTLEELKALFTPEELEEYEIEEVYGEEPYYGDVPETYDFRTNNPECAAAIKNQLSCGSCWAFAGSTALAMRFCAESKGAVNVVLSPQDSVSCDSGNWGCQGGNRLNTWYYYQNTGVVTESCFPYSSGKGKVEACIKECKNGEEWKKYKVTGVKRIAGVETIKEMLVTGGPIHTGFTVYEDFMQYKSGIYQHTSGSSLGGHAVVIIGYGSENGINYWIIQNSWGPEWGEQGYFRIKMGEVGIDSYAVVGTPVL